MAQGMFGAPIGIEAFQDSSRKEALAQSQVMRQLAEMSEIPSQIELRQSQSRLHRATAEEKEEEATRTRKLMEILSSDGQAAAPDPADRLSTVGEAMLRAGDFKGGREMINASSQIRLRQTTGVMREAQTERQLADAQAATQRTIGLTAGSARDQRSYEAAVMQLTPLLDTSQFPPSFEQGGKEVMEQLADQTMNAYQRTRAAQIEEDQRLRRREQETRDAERAARRPLIDAQRRLADARRERLEKGGGGTVTSPTKSQLIDTEKIFKEMNISFDVEEEGALARTAVAEEARKRVKQNAGLTLSEAIRQVVTEGVAKGDFPVADTLRNKLPGVTQTRRFTGAGKTPNTALPVPQRANGRADGTKMIKGRYYVFPDGRVWEWTGTGLLPAAPSFATNVDKNEDDRR